MPHAHHGHVCVVCDETVMLCTRDDCWVPDDWCCLRCEAIIRDEYFQAAELELTQPATTHKETTHEHQSSISEQILESR